MRKKIRVLIFGTFDRLHPGHIFFLNEAQRRGDLHVVVARDTTVRKIKGHFPIESEEERLVSVWKITPSAHVFLGDVRDFLNPIRSVKPDLIILGYDQRLPPGVSEDDFPCPVEKLPSYKPDRFKSSMRRRDTRK